MSVDLSIREQVVAVDDEDAESYVVALCRVHHQLSLLIHLKCFKLLLHPVWGPQKLPLGLRRLASSYAEPQMQWLPGRPCIG